MRDTVIVILAMLWISVGVGVTHVEDQVAQIDRAANPGFIALAVVFWPARPIARAYGDYVASQKTGRLCP